MIVRFSLLSQLSSEEITRWTPLCIDAKAEIEKRIIPGTAMTENNLIRLAKCAAALAFLKYTLYSPSGCAESFTAGAVNIRFGMQEAQRAKAVLSQELKEACDIVAQEDDFCFKGVRV